METAIITGSSGLIGSALVRRLARHFAIVGFDREGPPHPPPEAECVCIDLSSDGSVRKAFERVRYGYRGKIATVVHLAAYYDFSGEPSRKYTEINVRGTERLLDALRDFDVEQFVFSSTMLVHAPCEPGEHIDEDWALDPRWDYPRSKVEAETVIHARRGAIPAAILRIAGVYDDGCHSVPLAQQIRRVFERAATSKVFPGDIRRGQAFVHLEDVIDAIEQTVTRRGRLPAETTLLIGEPETPSYDSLQRQLGRLIHGEKWETQEIPKALAKAGAWLQETVPWEEPFIKPWMIDLADDHYELDISRARTLLEWQPSRSVIDTLPAMVAALKADPARWYRENELKPPPWLEPAAVTTGDSDEGRTS